MKTHAISGPAFAALLLVALLMGSNHIAARIAFDNGADVAAAVVMRSSITAVVVGLIILVQGVSIRLTSRHKKVLPLVGILFTIQSVTIYSSVARLPVSLALLAFNTYPLWIAMWARVLYQERPEPLVLKAMPVMRQWQEIGLGVAFALTAACSFGLGMVLIQHNAADLDGRVRTVATMAMVGVLTVIGAQFTDAMQWPTAAVGWWGLIALSVLYGTGFTIMFTVLPRLGVVGNSAIMNVEPIVALVLAWLILGQKIAIIQVVGACIVVTTVILLGLRKK
jgi:drug/metabolite transporter (DMT)-like permease